MTKIFSFILVSLLITVSASAQATHWRGPTGNGIYPDKNLLKEWPAEGPAMLWHFDELGEVDAVAPQRVGNGRVVR